MKRFPVRLALLLLSLFIVSDGFAQNGVFPDNEAVRKIRRELKENPLRYSDIHHRYEAPDSVVDTPAPAGYSPFYISHYGRHGSRYHAGGGSYMKLLNNLDTLHNLALLTGEGEALRSQVRHLADIHDGMVGILTHRGALEHQSISQRMFERYPSVFNSSDRTKVFAASSTIQRCILSMANFTMILKSNAPGLDIEMWTGEKYMSYILKEPESPRNSLHTSIPDSLLNLYFNPERIKKVWFTDADRAVAALGGMDINHFASSVLLAGSICQCLDETDCNLHSFLTDDELFRLWWVSNVKEYDSYAISIENEGRMAVTGKAILKDIVERADAAVAGNEIAADLRFGHDSGLLPLFAVMRVAGEAEPMKMADAPLAGWTCYTAMPMGSSLQMVFYKSEDCSSPVLVKILRNEKETSIPAVKPYCGPYYKWSDLRDWFEQCLER